MKSLVSVVITSIDRTAILRDTLKMLGKQTYDELEVVVVNSGKDVTIGKMIEHDHPIIKGRPVKFIKLPHQIPDSPARNIGVANSSGKYILFLDDDSFPGNYSIESAVKYFETDYQVGVVSFRIIDHAKYHARTYRSFNPFGNITPIDVFGFSGCGGMFRRSLFEQYGWMPETGQESNFEHTICLWAWNSGLLVKSIPGAYVYHHMSTVGKAADLRECKPAMYAGCFGIGLFAWQYFDGKELWIRMIKWWYQCVQAFVIHWDFKFIKIPFKFLWNINKYERHLGFKPEALAKVRLTGNFKGK